METFYARGSYYYVADNIAPDILCTAAEIGVADTSNVKTWVGRPNNRNKYINFKEIVLVDNTSNPMYISCINDFVAKNQIARFVNKPSVEAASKFPDEYFDFIYIDAAHYYKDVVSDLDAWQYKIKKHGFICGHDYDVDQNFDVNRAINEFAEARNAKVIKMHTEFAMRRSW